MGRDNSRNIACVANELDRVGLNSGLSTLRIPQLDFKQSLLLQKGDVSGQGLKGSEDERLTYLDLIANVLAKIAHWELKNALVQHKEDAEAPEVPLGVLANVGPLYFDGYLRTECALRRPGWRL